MNHAGERYAQQIEAARLAVGRGDRSAAVAALTAAIETTRGQPALHQEHTAALVRLGSLQQELGRPAEAECLLTEAILLGEQRLGADHPSLAVALNELSRLHIRQSEYARAETVLKRLLVMARAKGDRHPDVATALAGLALAKRGLGENAAAEVLYRHALKLREEVLAPDHMAIVVTLEQLSETCATRGNLAEALVLLHRALIKRERALGVEHATTRALRARMTDLERRVLKSSARGAGRFTPPAPATGMAPTPPAPSLRGGLPTTGPIPPARATTDRRTTPIRSRSVTPTGAQPTRSNELVFLYQPEAPARPARPTRERVSTPARAVAAVAPIADAVAPTTPSPGVGLSRITAPTPAVFVAPLPAAATSPVPAIADAPVIEPSDRDLSTLWASMKRTVSYASAGAAVVALAIAGSNIDASSGSESEHVASVSVGAESRMALTAPLPAEKSNATTGASASERTSGASPTAPSPTSTEPTRVSDGPAAPPSVTVKVPNLRRLVVPKVAMPSLDSMMRTAAKVAGDVISEPITAGGSLLASAPNDDAKLIAPVLIGPAPIPHFPDELRAQRLEGEVVVQFRVNEQGRVDASSMRVMQSGHELFTAAVRNALPKFRFEPARSAAPASKPQAAWVQYRAEFTARK
ncbi:MAG TPA: TonB family protein [Gemmatimonadaceae bacterium]|nr:TonB family protein [Gemmatimonadaceae bacterium]